MLKVICCFWCRSVGKRVKSAILWVGATAVVCALVLGILYGEFIPIVYLELMSFVYLVLNCLFENIHFHLQSKQISYTPNELG